MQRAGGGGAAGGPVQSPQRPGPDDTKVNLIDNEVDSTLPR